MAQLLGYERFSNEGKLTYIKLNSQTPCPPRSAVPVKEQRLQINFATHQVIIHGQNLRRIENAMQRMELSFVTKVSTNYQTVVTQGQPLILKIAVTETVPPKKQSLSPADSPE